MKLQRPLKTLKKTLLEEEEKKKEEGLDRIFEQIKPDSEEKTNLNIKTTCTERI